MGSAANASLVGAKTVNGPALESVSTRPPALSAVTSVERSGVALHLQCFSCAHPRRYLVLPVPLSPQRARYLCDQRRHGP